MKKVIFRIAAVLLLVLAAGAYLSGRMFLRFPTAEAAGAAEDDELPEEDGILADDEVTVEDGVLADDELPEEDGVLEDDELPEEDGPLADEELPEDADETGGNPNYVERYPGMVVPQAVTAIRLEAERKVKECRVQEGDEVTEGQVLFVYDTSEDQGKADQLALEIEKAKGELEAAEAAAKRLEREKKSANDENRLRYETDILTQKNAAKISEYGIRTKTLEAEKLQSRIESSEVRSEVDGVVLNIRKPDDDNMESDTPYMWIRQNGNFRIQCTLTEQTLPLITVGMEMTVFSRVDPNVTWKGTVSEVVTDDSDLTDAPETSDVQDEDTNQKKYRFYVELERVDGLVLGQHVYAVA